MMYKACRYGFVLLLVVFFTACTSEKPSDTAASHSDEVIYHVFLRSFYDSDGNGHGDLKGLQEKLDYLQDLGVTAVLVPPINSSKYYHNYFSDDFEKIDSTLGTEEDLKALLREMHRRKMKFYLDMETQYVTEDHAWWKDSYKNPSSKYSNYLIYNGKGNTNPESIIFNLTELPAYNGINRKVATVNMLNKEVLDYKIKLFRHWMDLDKDGKFDDGVDGFRLDHAMDDLDWKGKFTGLLTKFWKPLIDSLKQMNPQITFIAEQAYWGDYGKDYYEKAGIDGVFGFKLQNAFVSFDKTRLALMIDSTFAAVPPGKKIVVFLENHDMHRSSSGFGKDPGKEKLGAALNLLVGGVPAIYYGQELGMTGKKIIYGWHDGNDIPLREAFEWYKADSGKGMAIWYKDSGPWWDSTNLIPNDGISVEEEKQDSSSLYNFYRTLLHLRKSHIALVEGKHQPVTNNNIHVFTFIRSANNEKLLIAMNLSGAQQQATIDITGAGIKQDTKGAAVLPANNEAQAFTGNISFSPYAIYIWKIGEK